MEKRHHVQYKLIVFRLLAFSTARRKGGRRQNLDRVWWWRQWILSVEWNQTNTPRLPCGRYSYPASSLEGFFDFFFSSTDRHSSSVISEPINLTGRVSELPLFQNGSRCLSFKGKYITLTYKFTTFSYENLYTRSRFNKKSSGNLNRVHRMVYR